MLKKTIISNVFKKLLKENKMKKVLYSISAILLCFMLSSWGFKGHNKINQGMESTLPSGLSFLRPSWTLIVTVHCSDADDRKDIDPDEAPRHYIDIDNYPEFVQNGVISQYFDTVVQQHGLSWVIDQGILPWATLNTYDSLKAAFLRGDWTASALFAADLGHYLGDAHMPLHITRNYNGQYSGQSGVHSRYESKMINRVIDQIVYTPEAAQQIANVRGFIFSNLYENYPYVDSVLLADQYAHDVTGSYTSTAYLDTLWSKTKNFTTGLFSHASYSLGSLIYTAWVEAGSPVFFPNAIDELSDLNQTRFVQTSPNPFSESTRISIESPEPNTLATLEIYDSRGVLLDTIWNDVLPKGRSEIVWKAGELNAGIYFCVLKANGHINTRKILLAK